MTAVGIGGHWIGRLIGRLFANWMSDNTREPWTAIVLILFVAIVLVCILFPIITKRKKDGHHGKG